MKSRLNTFLISSKWGSEEEKEVDEIKLEVPEITNGDESPDSVADDALWDSLDTVTDTKASKAKKRPSIITNDSTNGSSKPKTKKKPKKKGGFQERMEKAMKEAQAQKARQEMDSAKRRKEERNKNRKK